MRMSIRCRQGSGGFSLVEVVLAMGIFSFAILALVGLLGPILRDSGEVPLTGALVEAMQVASNALEGDEAVSLAWEGQLDSFVRYGGRMRVEEVGGAPFWEIAWDDKGAFTRILEEGFADSTEVLDGPVFRADYLFSAPVDGATAPGMRVEIRLRMLPQPAPGTTFEELDGEFEAIEPQAVFPALVMR